MSLSPAILERIQAIEANLGLVDPVLRGFCQQHGYKFSSIVGVYPRRRVWQRAEVDRCLDLTSDLTVPEIMERGFYPEMPWSLHATASLPTEVGHQVRMMEGDVFRGVPFSQLGHVLATRLEDGL